jgi:MFS transporter, NNP family, nitrate/nitrite transporter
VVLKKSLVEWRTGANDAVAKPLWLDLRPVFFLALIFFINFIGRMILSPLLPTIEKELAISHGQAGSFFFLMSAGYVIGLLGSGFFASRSNHRITIVVSSTGVGFALLCISLSNSLSTMRTGLFCLGLTAGLYIPSAIATITALVEQRRWGKAIAIHELAPNLAFFAAPFIAQGFLAWSNWRMALSCIGAASLIVGLTYHRFGRGGEFPGESPASNAFATLIRMPVFWLMVVLFGIGVSTTIGVYAMLPLYLVSERHLDQSWANTVVALSRSCGPLLGLVGGLVSDRLGPRRTMTMSLAFTGIVTILLGPASGRWISAIVILQPLLAVWFFPAGFAVLAAITRPDARNLAVAFTVPAGYIIGGGAVPAFIGIMGDAGFFAIGYVVTGVFILAGAGLALLLRLPAREDGSR